MTSQDVCAAEDPASSPAVLGRLSRHPMWEVRHRVALNPTASRSVLFDLLGDDAPVVSGCATRSLLPRLNDRELHLLATNSPKRRGQLLSGCDTPAPVGLATPNGMVVPDDDFNRLRAALGHPDPVTTEDYIERGIEVVLVT